MSLARDSLGLDAEGLDLGDLDAVLSRLKLNRSVPTVPLFGVAPPRRRRGSGISSADSSRATPTTAIDRRPTASPT